MLNGRSRTLACGGRVALAAIIAGALGVNVIVGHARTMALHVDADSLWPYAFLADLFSAGGRLADWDFGQHADVVPDRLVAALAYAVTGSPESWLLAYGLLNTVWFFLFAWYCLYLHRRAAVGPTNAAPTALLAAVLAVGTPLFARSWGLFENFLHHLDFPSHHFGSFLAGILAAIVAIDGFDRPMCRRTILRLALAAGLFALCANSDKLAILVVLPAFLTTAVVFAVLRGRPGPMLPVTVAAVTGAAALAYATSDLVWNYLAQQEPDRPRLQWDASLPQGRLLLQALLGSGITLQSVATGLLAVAALALALAQGAAVVQALAGRRRPDRSPTAAAIVFFLVAVAFLDPLLIIAIGQFPSEAMARYVFPSVYCIVLALAAGLGAAIPVGWPRSRLVAGTAAACLALAIVPIRLADPPFGPATAPPLARCLDAFAAGDDLAMGLGYHWDTYPVNLWSERRIVVRTIRGDAEVWHWANSLEWYAPRADGRLFTFIVLSPEISEPALRGRFGEPAKVLRCDSLGPGYGRRTIWIYDRAAAARLTAAITAQYRDMKR